MRKLSRSRKRLLAAVVVAGLAAGWGLALWLLNFGLGLRNLSYDLPFMVPREAPEEIVLVYLDEVSHRQLGQSLAERWDRRFHADLVDRLAAEGARTIVFDILFHESVPAEDARFAEAIKAHGQVVLAGEFVRGETANSEQQMLLLATPDLRRAAAGSGLTFVIPDADGKLRRLRHQIPTDFGDRPGLAAQTAAVHAGREVEGTESTLLNYYGPAGTFPGFSYADVLEDTGLPADAFEDKVVIVGARQQTGMADAGKDTFPTPYSVFTRENTPGAEINATATANLLQDEPLRMVSPGKDRLAILLGALLLALPACLFSPGRGLLLCLTVGIGYAVAGFLLHGGQGLVLTWTIPAFGQLPLVIGLALASHYLIEYSARWKLRRAFKSYMSDEQARQIDEDEVSLELGGREVEATILFSDLAGFTSMSEGLPPQSVSKALISYFESATAGILDNDGTIIKYVGDAVMATWGAPLRVEREADRAIDAAIQMQHAGRTPIQLETAKGTREQVLETRIGINSGLGLAGNLGSRRRFDYSVIGDTTNTAARLEGLNKMLGTSILVSDAVLGKCVDRERYTTRLMGSYVLKGKAVGIVVHEVLGHVGQDPVRERSEHYLQNYREGLEAFQSARWEEATVYLTKALGQHDRLEEDPASRLMLDTIAAFGDRSPSPEEWQGEVALQSK